MTRRDKKAHFTEDFSCNMNKGQRFQLRHSVLEMNDCVRELSFDQHYSSRCRRQQHVSSKLANANFAKQLDNAILDAIASRVSAFCSFPSSPAIRKRNASSLRREISSRLPCYGKELSPLNNTSAIIPSDRSTDLCSNYQPFHHSYRRQFLIHRKRKLHSLATGLKKVKRYLKRRKPRKILLSL